MFVNGMQITNLLSVHESPIASHSSISFDVRHFFRRSCASAVSSGEMTRDGSSGPPFFGSWHASTTRLSGVKRKCTSSGAFGSWM